jgi:L-erythro-3,5-diaminohexanoate dehydrogenase
MFGDRGLIFRHYWPVAARPPSSPLGLHRVRHPAGVLPQAADVLDADSPLWPDEVAIDVELLNLDAASFRQLLEAADGDGAAVRRRVREIVRDRGKMHNPVTGSGGMLVGTVAEVGPDSPLGLELGQRVATLVSLSLTPLRLDDDLQRWDGLGEQVATRGRAVLFARSLAAPLPPDLPDSLALGVLDVCGAPALTARTVRERGADSVAVLGAAGKSGSLALAAAADAGASRRVGVVRDAAEAAALQTAGVASEIIVADARDPVRLAAALGKPVEVTVVCVDVAGCEGSAVLATAAGGVVVFFSMTTSFAAAALGAEGVAADVTLLIGNGYLPGHADYALGLVRSLPGVRRLVEARIAR